MPEYCLFIIAAIVAYLVSGINPAIVMSKAIYHKDIRTCGSGNPGFTNFKREFGNVGWLVLILDLGKSALLVGVFGLLFKHLYGHYQLGVAFTGLMAMIGHCYPIYYKFKGGKGFLVGASAIFFMDYRAGLIAFAVMLVILLSTHFMSLGSILSGISCPISLALFNLSKFSSDSTIMWATEIICIVSVLFMTYRHKGNIVRLFKGQEKKFYFKKKKVENTTN